MSTDFVTHLGIDDHPTEVLRVTPGPEHRNAGGTVHGGFLATLLDTSMGTAVREGLEEGQTTVTAAMTITFLAAAKAGEELTTSTEVLKRGSSLVMVSAVATNPDGKDVAHAVGTFSVLDED